MAAGVSSHGTLVRRAPAATPSTYATVGELLDITPPPLMRNSHETTPQQDGDDAYVVSYRRKGELNFSINLVMGDGTHDESTGLIYSYTQGSLDNWRMVLPDGSTMTFAGYIVELAIEAPNDGVLTAEVTVRPSGATTWA